MTAEETFDSFYRSTREHLVLQAFLLTGDLTAATSAVRAYVITWQHWRKVSLRPDQSGGPLSFTRPLAWRLASRRHTGRIWHRNKGLTDTEREVLDAVHQLTGGERRALLLFEVAEVPLAAGAANSPSPRTSPPDAMPKRGSSSPNGWARVTRKSCEHCPGPHLELGFRVPKRCSVMAETDAESPQWPLSRSRSH